MAAPAPIVGPQEVLVTITVGSSGINVSPDPFRISKSAGQQVVWACGDAFTVEFNKNGSPFHASSFSDQSPRSGPVRGNVTPDPNKTYGYTVKAGGRTLDPGGIVY